jgi:hypothetical protein
MVSSVQSTIVLCGKSMTLSGTDCFIDDGSAIWIASSVETNIGIIFTCLHAIRPVLSKIVPGLFGTGASSGKTKYLKTPDPATATATAKKYRFKSITQNSTWASVFNKNSSSKSGSKMSHTNQTDSTVELNSITSNKTFAMQHGHSKARVSIGTGGQNIPRDKIMYAQEVIMTATGGNEANEIRDDADSDDSVIYIGKPEEERV